MVLHSNDASSPYLLVNVNGCATDGSPADADAYWAQLTKELKETWGDEEFAEMTKPPEA